MKSIIEFLSCLQQAKFLSFKQNPTKTFDLKLEENALKLQALFLKAWQINNHEWMQINLLSNYKYYKRNYENHTSFINCKQFHKNCELYYKLVANGKPTVIKSIAIVDIRTVCGNFFTLTPTIRTLLISDYFVKASKGLEKFYNLQRKRKIWWMLNAANPSAFFVKASPTSQNYPSATIQVQFPFDALNVESLTYVSLNGSRNKLVKPIGCIRSTIALEAATFAMLLNAVINNRDRVLLLNQKLVPYQCYLSHLSRDTQSNSDINDLYLHITRMLQRAGLRLYQQDFRADSKQTVYDELKNADLYGIPYSLLIDNESLSTGFIKLRSRDTTLMETIHLNDLPIYLLNILNV